CEGDVRLVARDVAAPLAIEPIDVDSPAVEIERQQFAAVFGRPLVGQIDHRPAVSVAAAELVAPPAVFAYAPAAAALEMKMIGVAVDRVIHVAVGSDRRAPRVVHTGG